MNPDPLYVEDADDEPWAVPSPDRPESRWLTMLRIATVAAVLVVLALVVRR